MSKTLQAILWIALIGFSLITLGGYVGLALFTLMPPTIVQAQTLPSLLPVEPSLPPAVIAYRETLVSTLENISPSLTPTLSLPPTLPPTETPLPSLTPEPTFTLAPIPESARINGISGEHMRFTLDCEARAAVDLAAFLGIQIDEMEFLDRLPQSDDPESGFVGYYNDTPGQIPPASYGAHAPPVATLLQEYGIHAQAHKPLSFESLKAEIAAGRPVMIWVVGDMLSYGRPLEYTASNGNTTTVVHYEHVVLATGYTPSTVTVLNGDWVQTVSTENFLSTWKVLGNMAITIQ